MTLCAEVNATAVPLALPSGFCPQSCILTGKSSLDMGDLEKALVYLTAAYDEMPYLGDYILFWRAAAFNGKSETQKALNDLSTIKKIFPESPLIKKIRLMEIEIHQKNDSGNTEELLQRYISDYPSDQKVRFAYAVYLKGTNKKEKAKALFREIFVSVSPYAKSAGEELSDAEIRAADLLKKGRNLNNAWLFKESERQFRNALQKKDSKPLKREITEGLALSLFRQKRYREAAQLYAECEDMLGRAKSLYRSGDWERFEKEIFRMRTGNDPRAASLLVAYGSKKRRSGDVEKALAIYEETLSRFPSAKEDALWHKGWTYYRTGDHKKALDIFSSLHKIYGSPRYLYWKNRCIEILGSSEPRQEISYVLNDRNNNFYLFLSSLRAKVPVPPYDKMDSGRCSDYKLPKRIEVLETLGFNKEALSEINTVANRSNSEKDIACLSAHLVSRRDFKTSIALVSRLPFREELHDLYYPPAYLDVAEEAGRNNNLDPLLILSIMREESRFASDARSVAGALGLMQMMPQTASKISKRAKVSLHHSEDLYDAHTNILLGAYYLASLVKHFGSLPPAIASYNAGEEAVKEWIASGKYGSMDEFIEDIPFDETRNYVKKVITSYFEYMRQQGKKEIPSHFMKSGNI
jgi:soluble lytic murein transglycosylase